MSEKVYGVRSGQVQFDPKRDRVVNGQSVTDITFKVEPSGTLVQVTIWPEFAGPGGLLKDIIKKGDWVSVDGELTTRAYQDGAGAPQTSFGINAFAIAHVSSYIKPPRGVVQAPVTPVAAPVPVAAQPVAQPVAAVAAQPVAPAADGGFPVAAPVADPAATQGAPF